MNMAPDEEQGLFQEALARYLRETLTLAELRRAATGPAALHAQLWGGLVDLGVTGILVPQEFGGSGLGLQDAALAAQEIGAAAAPVPFAGAVVMASQALLLAGSPGQRSEWLPRIASGDARIAIAFASALSGQTGRGAVSLAGERLSADIDGLLEAECATHFLLFLADGRAALVEADAAVLDTRASADALRRVSRVRMDQVAAQVLQGAGDPRATALRVLDGGRIALACDAFGAAQAMLDKSVAYAKERVQFGRPIGSFQGVKYLCADMVTQLEPCRALLWHAASLHDAASPESRVAALQARAHVADVAREVSRMAVEVHGGVGFTDMLGLPFWFARIALDRQMLGGPDRCREEAAQVQGWTMAPR